MRDKYIIPVMEIVEFDESDIIVTSYNPNSVIETDPNTGKPLVPGIDNDAYKEY